MEAQAQVWGGGEVAAADGLRFVVPGRTVHAGRAVARVVFHGKKSELRQRYRDGMEDQLGALGLVGNALVLWNTRYLQRALEYSAPDDVGAYQAQPGG
ncbi:TnpA family transposase [Hymenobacter sp. UYP22]